MTKTDKYGLCCGTTYMDKIWANRKKEMITLLVFSPVHWSLLINIWDLTKTDFVSFIYGWHQVENL